LKELAILFLKLGTIAFGGPAAHIALMEEEVVRRRAWLTRQEFLDCLGAANLLPGPSSTELAIFIGYKREGLRGLALAGICFILPAMLIVWLLAQLYVQMGTLPAVSGVLYGIKAVIVAIIVQAVLSLGRTAIKTVPQGMVAIGAAILFTAGINALIVLLIGGFAALLSDDLTSSKALWRSPKVWLVCAGAAVMSGSAWAVNLQRTAPAVTLGRLFLFFVKVGSVVFGSGYVLLAFLQTDLVNHWHWLTQTQLLDAIAVGQFTPGPVFTTATFIGYLLAGNKGAVVATIGIFLPGFLWVAVSGALIPRIRRSKRAGAFLNGVNASSLALMAAVAFQLGRSALVDWTTAAVAVMSSALLFKFRVNSLWLILGGSLIGFAKTNGIL
jgi:chromate transporter